MSAKQNQELEYITKYYAVPAVIGQRVEYTQGGGVVKQGRIIGAKGAYIRIHFDNDTNPHMGVFHPTWNMKYL